MKGQPRFCWYKFKNIHVNDLLRGGDACLTMEVEKSLHEAWSTTSVHFSSLCSLTSLLRIDAENNEQKSRVVWRFNCMVNNNLVIVLGKTFFLIVNLSCQIPYT